MKRIQRKRTKSWKMPSNVVYVGRPSKWGNPYKLSDGFSLKESLIQYNSWVELQLDIDPHFLDLLKGKDLACWCKLDERCHADIIIQELRKAVEE